MCGDRVRGAFSRAVEQLVLYGSYADGASIAPPAAREAIVAAVRSHWGLGSRLLSDIFLGEASSKEQESFARFQRLAASADTAAALLEQVYRNDVRDQLPLVTAPTLVVHRRGDRAIRTGSVARWPRGSGARGLFRWRAPPTSRGLAMPTAWSGRFARYCQGRASRSARPGNRRRSCCRDASARCSSSSRSVSATARSPSS